MPNLRFPEFSGEWVETTIGDVAPLQRGFDLPTKDVIEGTYPVVYSNGILMNHKYYKCEAPGLITGRSGSIGNFTYINEGKYWPHNTSLWVTNFNNNYPLFIYYLYQTIDISQYSSGASVPTLNRNDVHKHTVSLPEYNEQTKIADFLAKIDERIETQKKIIEKYESLIRGLCDHLTRQGTANKTINECLECHSSTLQESSVLEDGKYPVYGATGVCGYTDTPDVSGDGILIIKDGASVGTTSYAEGCYSAIGTLNRLTAKQGINLRYLYYCLKVMNFAPYKTGLAIPHIYFKDYGKHKIWCPSFERQSRIADALTKIDNKIQIEKSLLECLNSQKRYLLNQLFI